MLNIDKINLLIKEHGWSKAHFCRLFDRSRTWIDDWKRGVGVPKDNMLQAIADKLGTTVEYLTDQTDIKNKPVPKNGDELNLILQNRAEIEFIKLFSTLNSDQQEKILADMKWLKSQQDEKE